MNGFVERMAPAGVGFAISAAFLVWSYAYDGRAHVVPMLIGWCAAALTLLDIYIQTDTRGARALRAILSGRPLDASELEEAGAVRASGPVRACLWPAAFVALVAAIGFVAAIPVYTLAFMRLQGGLPWRHSAIAAVAIATVTWIVFEQLLRYKVFEGALFGGQF